MTLVLEDENIIKSKNESSFSSQKKPEVDLTTSAEEVKEVKNHRFYYSIEELNILLEQDIDAENLPQSKVYNLPHSPEWCSGIVNIRGAIVPVVNMRYFFKIKTNLPIKKSKLLLIKNNSIEPIIFQIDKLPAMINFDDYSTAISQKDSPSWADSVLTDSNNTILQVNHITLLNQLIK